MSILVTAASGQLGHLVVDHLLERGADPADVVAGARTVEKAADRPHYVQLGDSFSSGNGAGNYTDRTCWRSRDNYGARVARSHGATYTNVACSGGVIDDIFSPRELGSATWRTRTYEVPVGTVNARARWLKQAKADRLCGTPAQKDYSYEYSVRSSASLGSLYTATVRCQLVARPQIDAVTRQTDAVFLTIGGNDIGFTSIVTNCLVLREASSCKDKMTAADEGLADMKRRTKQALKAIHDRSGGRADVYLLGYPHLINTDSYRIGWNYDAGLALTKLQLRGDALQRQAVREVDRVVGGSGGFTFVDVKPAWGGYTHGLNPHALADQRSAWLVPVLGVGNVYYEWVHPTPAGWGASALALSTSMT